MSTDQQDQVEVATSDPQHTGGIDETTSTLSAEDRQELEDFRAGLRSVEPKPREEKLLWPEVLLGVLAMVGWIAFFAMGTIVATQAWRDQITSGEGDGSMLVAWLVVLSCYTIPNTAVISFLAAVAGEFSSRAWHRLESIKRHHTVTLVAPTREETLTRYATAGTRGFVLYLLIMSGLLVIATDAIAKTDQGQYLRIAALLSVVAFVAGYDVMVFRRSLERVISLIAPGAERQSQK